MRIKVHNLISPKSGREVANQFDIAINVPEDHLFIRIFQSYNTVIVEVIAHKGKSVTTLDKDSWDFSRTTSKYRNEWLGESTYQTQKKIDSGEYKLGNLNGG